MKKISVTAVILMLALLLGAAYASAGSHGAPELSGKVVETMDSGGYTYVQIEKGGNKTWVAVPRTEVKKGQDISFLPGMMMKGFKSKSLDRTFDTIYFSEGVME